MKVMSTQRSKEVQPVDGIRGEIPRQLKGHIADKNGVKFADLTNSLNSLVVQGDGGYCAS